MLLQGLAWALQWPPWDGRGALCPLQLLTLCVMLPGPGTAYGRLCETRQGAAFGRIEGAWLRWRVTVWMCERLPRTCFHGRP